MRGVSTVVDVTIFLLVVSVAVATLAVPPAREAPARADETANRLGRTTANGTFHAADDEWTGPEWRVSGTHAGLLGRAALADRRLDGRRLAPTSGQFLAAATARTERALDWSRERTSVTAVWEPYPDAPLQGHVHVGTRPPAGADVSTATLSVSVPVGSCRGVALSAAPEGYEGVARATANCLLDATLPARAGSVPDAGTAAGRVTRRQISAYEAALGLGSERSGFDARRRRIESALAARLASDLRERYESPRAAAAAVRTGTVRVVVREWDP